MAFKIRDLNHSPKWYHEHCAAEDGGSAAFRAMLTADMKFVAADIDSKATYQERVDDYEEMWNAILSGRENSAAVGDLQAVLEREGQLGFRAEEEYMMEPFRSFTRLMTKHNVSAKDVKEFLKWRDKNGDAAAEMKEPRKESSDTKKKRKGREWLLNKNRWFTSQDSKKHF